MSTMRVNAILDAAGGNTATINGLLPISQSVTLLGTLATTSGGSVTLSGLTLTSYKFLICVFNSVSGTSGASAQLTLNSNFVGSLDAGNSIDQLRGAISIELSSGMYWGSGATVRSGTQQSSASSGGFGGVTNSSTSITFSNSNGLFDLGSIIIYGVK